MRIFKIILLTVVVLTVQRVDAQYFNAGQNPFSVRWKQINTPGYRIVYPENYGLFAQSVGMVIDSSAQSLTFGYSMAGQKVPFILQTQNLRSNGFVVWAPKRLEMVMTPPIETYATPWFKQLAVHEYRHVVQMSNLRRNFLKTASYVGGEQIVGMGAALMPIWYLEGDATLAETALTGYGRALQPEFTLEYRAYLENHDMSQFTTDKWFCGSFKDYIPDHYKIGYQITNWSYRNMGTDFWEKMTDYSAKYPYLLIPRGIAFRKFYRVTVEDMMKASFGELKSKWDSLPKQDNSARVIHTPLTSYTTYSYPLFVDDTTIVALKNDLDYFSRFVSINTTTGAERHIRYTGVVSSRPTIVDGEIFWTEYRPSTFWEQKNLSVVCRMGLNGVQKVYRNRGNLFFITRYGDNIFAAAEYHPEGYYDICFFDDEFNKLSQFEVPDSLTVHGLAYDEPTNTLAMITLGEDGMALSKIDGQKIVQLTKPSFVSINNLNAGSGRLTFNSIESGRDEVHIYDIASGKEFRVTNSRFGSIMPSISGDKVAQVTFSVSGYEVSTQSLDSLTEVNYTQLPRNILNAPIAKFDNFVNIDTMKILHRAPEKPTARYRKGATMINVHSWLPVSYNPLEIVDQRNFDFAVGATVVSQNVLSTTTGFLSYGFVNSNSLVKGGLQYYGFAPKIEVNAEYGGGRRFVYAPSTVKNFPQSAYNQFFDLEARVSLPMNLSGGYQLRWLTPSVTISHNNALLYNPYTKKFDEGYQIVESSLSYTENVRRSYRDIAPRWGYSAKISYSAAPASDLLGSLYSVVGGVFTPGVMPLHSLRINGAVQRQQSKLLNFSSNVLFPRGLIYNINPERIATTTATYRFPLVYPDTGLSNIIYFKRVIGGFFGGYSRFRQEGLYNSAYSYGAEAIINSNPLRMRNASLDFNLAIFKTSDTRGANFAFGVAFVM